MIKYVISSGTSVVCELIDNSKFNGVKITDDSTKAITYSTIAEAMTNAIKVNKILGSNSYRAISIELN